MMMANTGTLVHVPLSIDSSYTAVPWPTWVSAPPHLRSAPCPPTPPVDAARREESWRCVLIPRRAVLSFPAHDAKYVHTRSRTWVVAATTRRPNH